MAVIALNGRTNLTWSELINICATRLGKLTNMDTEIENELVMAQLELEQRVLLPEWLTTTVSSFTLMAQASTDLPSTAYLSSGSMRATYDDGAMYLKDSQADSGAQHKILQRVSFDDIRQEAVEDPASGVPKYYALRTTADNVEVELFPGVTAEDVASGRFTLYWRGKSPYAFGYSAISGNEATVADGKAWITRASALIVEMACYRIGVTISSPKTAEFKSERDRLFAELEKTIAAEEVRDTELFMGGG